MYNHWATAPGRSLNYPRPKSITHLRTFSDNGVYVALQLFLVILVSDQWRRVLIPYSYRQAPWGLLHARGWLSRYTWDQQLYMVSEPRETHSPMLKARFLHLTNFGSSRDRTHDLLPTRPTRYHSATALYNVDVIVSWITKTNSQNFQLATWHQIFYVFRTKGNICKRNSAVSLMLKWLPSYKIQITLQHKQLKIRIDTQRRQFLQKQMQHEEQSLKTCDSISPRTCTCICRGQNPSENKQNSTARFPTL